MAENLAFQDWKLTQLSCLCFLIKLNIRYIAEYSVELPNIRSQINSCQIFVFGRIFGDFKLPNVHFRFWWITVPFHISGGPDGRALMLRTISNRTIFGLRLNHCHSRAGESPPRWHGGKVLVALRSIKMFEILRLSLYVGSRFRTHIIVNGSNYFWLTLLRLSWPNNKSLSKVTIIFHRTFKITAHLQLRHAWHLESTVEGRVRPPRVRRPLSHTHAQDNTASSNRTELR